MAKARSATSPGGSRYPLAVDAPVNWPKGSETLVESGRPSVQSRCGEELRIVSMLEELRAIYSSPFFWTIAAELPCNQIQEQKFGRPQDYPDWVLFLLVCAAGITGISTVRSSVALLVDQKFWTDFARDVDQFVPTGWTRIADLDHSLGKHEARRRPRTGRPRKQRQAHAGNVVSLAPRIGAVAPRRHHLSYFAMKWRGRKKVNGRFEPMSPGDPWCGVRQQVFAKFREMAMVQAQQQGLLNPLLPFQWQDPNREQYVGFDGTIFPMTPKRASTACSDHASGGSVKPIYGTKFTFASLRINGVYGSRLILDFSHNGKDPLSDYPNEGAATKGMALRLNQEAQGGMKGIIVDSVVRGSDLVELQRNGVTVVNYPHAHRNPGSKDGGRLAEGRQEKGHLRTVIVSANSIGGTCEHPLYLVGGSVVERFIASDGTPQCRPVAVVGYDQRQGKNVRREYLAIRIECTLCGTSEHRVPLFHTDPTSTDPDANWGEYARVFPPSSPQFRHLYGARNDTESRHTNLKARVKHLPPDVPGQMLRLLGAMIATNSVAWQLHQQELDAPNVFDNTA